MICAFVTASAQGHLDVVNLLIQNGVDVNAAGLEGPEGERFLALPAAVASGRADVVKVLLQNGADVNANCGGENITHFSRQVQVNVTVAHFYYFALVLRLTNSVSNDMTNLLNRLKTN